jgi:hypothetical protein
MDNKFGTCLQRSLSAIEKDPTLQLFMGPPGRTGDTAHFWTVRKDGTVYDPTPEAVSKSYAYKGRVVDPSSVKAELSGNIMESLRMDLRQVFIEGTIKLPTAEIESWLKSHIDEIVAKLKETAAQGYQTYVDDGINVKNPYTNEPLDVTLYINKKLTLPDNDTIDPVLYYDAKTSSIHINAKLVLQLYKSKNTLYAALLKGIIHELTHAVDPGRAHKTNDMGSYDEYINNSVEFPAFANMYLNKLKNKIQSGKLQVDALADAIRSGKKIPDIEVGGFMNKLNPENRTKFINYIYKELIA